jgi:hypothetical protein
LIFGNPLKPLSEMSDEELTAITCGGKTASFSNILSSERAGSIIIKGIHPSKDRPSTAKTKFSKQIIYADMNLAAVPRPCAFPQLQVRASPLSSASPVLFFLEGMAAASIITLSDNRALLRPLSHACAGAERRPAYGRHR